MGEPITLLENLRAVFYAPFYMAVDRGYFADAGADVRFVESPDPGDTLPRLIRGEVDVCWGGPLRVIRTHEQRRSGPTLAAQPWSSSLAHHFSADDVTRGKPAPDLYLLAADALGGSSERCLVLEDSVSGVQASATRSKIWTRPPATPLSATTSHESLIATDSPKRAPSSCPKISCVRTHGLPGPSFGS